MLEFQAGSEDAILLSATLPWTSGRLTHTLAPWNLVRVGEGAALSHGVFHWRRCVLEESWSAEVDGQRGRAPCLPIAS